VPGVRPGLVSSHRTMLRSAKKALLPVSPATRSRISSSVNPANRRNSSLETTDITLGASESFCANLDAVVTLVLNSASRSIENGLLAALVCLSPSCPRLPWSEPSCGRGWPRLAVAVNHKTEMPMDRIDRVPRECRSSMSLSEGTPM